MHDCCPSVPLNEVKAHTPVGGSMSNQRVPPCRHGQWQLGRACVGCASGEALPDRRDVAGGTTLNYATRISTRVYNFIQNAIKGGLMTAAHGALMSLPSSAGHV